MVEQWRYIAEYEGYYQVSNFGRIKSMARTVSRWTNHLNLKEKIKPSHKGYDGYLRVELSKDGKCTSYLVHRLVAIAFIPNPENKKEVNHKNGDDKSNNHVDNLEWNTREENIKHAFDTGLKDHRGTKHPRSILTEEDVFEILDMVSNGISNIDIANILGFTKHMVTKVRTGKTWGHLTGIKFEKTYRTPSDDEVIAIFKALQAGEAVSEISKKYGVSKSCIWKIRSGTSYSKITGVKTIKQGV